MDAAAQNLAKRLRRHKRKLRDHHITSQEGVQRQQAQSRVLAGYDIDSQRLEDIAEVADEQPLIIAESSASIQTLSVADAVTALDLSNESALMFTNSVTGRTNMLYRRNDGNLGWLEPMPH